MGFIKRQHGFTLLELLISVAISSIILLTLASLFQEQGKTYKAQDQLAVAGQRTRLAMDNLARELGLAGYGVPAITSTATAPRAVGNSKIYLPNTSGFNNSDIIYLCGSGLCESATISSVDPQAPDYLTISAGLVNPVATGDTVFTIKDDRSNLTLEGIVDSTYNSAGFNNAYFGAVWGSRNIFSHALDTTEKTISFFANIEQIASSLSQSIAAGPTATALPVTDNVGALNQKDLIFISDGGRSESAAVSSATGTTINLASGGLTNDYPLGASISNADLIVYSYDTGAKTLKRSINGGSFDPFVENIDYFQLRYYDSARAPIPNPAPNPYTGISLNAEERASIREINIQIVAITTIDDPQHTSSGTYDDGTVYNDKRHRVTLETNLFMRNLVK